MSSMIFEHVILNIYVINDLNIFQKYLQVKYQIIFWVIYR